MRLAQWMPRPAAWANGVALFIFAAVVRMTFGIATPLLVALMRHWPRLAWLCLLLLWLSPIAGAAAIHDAVARLIGQKGPASREARFAGAAGWWAGFVAWSTIIVVTMTVTLVIVALDPPPIVDPESVWKIAANVTSNGVGTASSIIWIVLAAYVYELEIRARKPAASP